MLIRSQGESPLRRFMGKTSVLYNVGYCRQYIYIYRDVYMRMETAANRPNRRILRTKEVSTMYRSSTTSYPLFPIMFSK